MVYKNIHGGGSQTNLNGLSFERETDLRKQLEKLTYLAKGQHSSKYFFCDEASGEVTSYLVAELTEKYAFYSSFLKSNDIYGDKILSKKYFQIRW